MRALKVFLFITLVLFAIFGLFYLFFPATMADLGVASSDEWVTRISAAGILAFALALWFAFRDPQRNTAIILIAIVWLSLEALLILISAIAGAATWANTLPGIIIDGVLVAGLAYFYPRGEKAT